MLPGVLGVQLLNLVCFVLTRLLEALVHRETPPFWGDEKPFFVLG